MNKLIKTGRKREACISCAAILFLLACEWFFFRQMYGSDRLFGDLGDGRLTTLIAEHWYHVFRGEASVGALGMFWPETNTLGYSDLLMGYGVIHSLLRVIGLNVYVAYKYTILLVHAFGTFCCYFLLRRALGVKTFWSLFGTVAFSFADTAIMALGHTQLAAVWMLPLFGIFAVRFFRNIGNRKMRNIYAYAAVIQIVLVLYTAWYMAFFTALFTCTLAAVVLVILLIRKSTKKEIGRFFRTVRWDIAGYLLCGIVLVVPFVLLELPVLKASGGFGYAVAAQGLPQVTDLIHVTHTNLLLGDFFRNSAEMSGRSHEVIRGYSFVLLIMFITGIVVLGRECRKERRCGGEISRLRCAALEMTPGEAQGDTGVQDDTSGMNRRVMCFAVSIAVILDLLLIFRTAGGFSLWKAVYKFFPGANSIRAVGRFMLFLSLPMSLVTAVMMDGRKSEDTQRKGNKVLYAALCGCLMACLLVSNVNTGKPGYWTEGEALARIRSVRTPPEDCEVFYITHPDPGESLPLQQTEAWEIADALGVKTINGYSGQYPPGWGGIWDIASEGYEKAVKTWVSEKQLTGVYEYNQEENKWIKSMYCPW